MIVTSPNKKKTPKQNRRKVPNRKSNLRQNGSGATGNFGKRISDQKKKKRLSFPNLKPWKIILGAFTIGILGTLYLNHVFATQELLREVEQLERQYNQAERVHNDYRLDYDRMIGPAEIYQKAQSAGMINGGPAEKVIEVEPE